MLKQSGQLLNNNKGITLTEMVLVMTIIAIILGGAFILYDRSVKQKWVATNFETIMSVVGQINSIMYLRNSLPVSATDVNMNTFGAGTELAGYFGINNTSLNNLTYRCTGGVLTITVNNTNIPENSLMLGLREIVNQRIGGVFTVSIVSGNSFTITRNVACS